MLKAMIFIDGTWLYRNLPKLAASYGNSSYRIDFGKLPGLLRTKVAEQLGASDLDIVRTHLFGSYPENYDLVDEGIVAPQLDFFSMLKEEFHYELDLFPINFRGRHIRKKDRDPNDPFEPKEKCVDIALATSMLYFAAIPHAYEIAIAVIGDRDYKPVLQHVRRLGKRVAIASAKNACWLEFANPRDESRLKDFDIIWLDDHLHELELKYDTHPRECESPTHKGDRKVWTTFHPRKGQKFYCDACRAEFERQKQQAQREFVSSQSEALPAAEEIEPAPLERSLAGEVYKVIRQRQYGFIRTTDGRSYFFHLTDLQNGLEFDAVHEGLAVGFEIKREPEDDKAGAAQNVHLLTP